ncbi:hypothetical protein [Pseudoalteromonas sp. Of7M-16]|uniref:hypothetical protein n=1 Tax=Pseudoalteromonas sp. Of7M-16 TaxID=2917756 RepID=UPI001EF41364|nr:hypothetical protein [Pseudoalteromonas sp. Of7M-16]MCG7551339.1 hypothetical protein [Pseudoalteromonas sp. Of7M-16]
MEMLIHIIAGLVLILILALGVMVFISSELKYQMFNTPCATPEQKAQMTAIYSRTRRTVLASCIVAVLALGYWLLKN